MNFSLKSNDREHIFIHIIMGFPMLLPQNWMALVQLLPKTLLEVICDDESFNLAAYGLKDDQRTKFPLYKEAAPIVSSVHEVPWGAHI